MGVATDTCENCGNPIGKLETPFVWQDHAVCAECHEKLNRPTIATAERLTPADAIGQPSVHLMPIHAVMQSPLPGVQTIEKTGKQWKQQMLLALLLVVIGVVVMCSGCSMVVNRHQDGGAATLSIGFAMIVAGLGWGAVARLLAWWHHG